MDEENFLNKMMLMAQKSGDMALEFMEDSSPSLKGDQSVLTKADMAISKYIRNELSELLEREGHLLVDEEDQQSDRLFDQGFLNKSPYLWSIDPIDGTRGYANQMPTYGISLGLLKNCSPWLGVIYLPTLQELFYCDGRDSFFIKKAFSSEEEKSKIVPVDQVITAQSIFLGSESLLKLFDWNYDLCSIMLPACAVIDLCYPSVGRACGSIFDAHLWDMAGSWPILKSAGLQLYSLQSGRALEKINVDLFQGQGSKTWRFKEHYILSSARNFPLFQKNIQKKDLL